MNLDDINITFKVKGRKGVFRLVNRIEGLSDGGLIRPWNTTTGKYYGLITVSNLKKYIEDGTFYDIEHRKDLPLKIRVYATHWTAST